MLARVAIEIARAGRLVCEVARTAAEQARGLQGHAPLVDGTGMLFPFFPPRAARFWMGSVSFPIDLVFADASGRIARIVHSACPGTRSTWSHPVVGAVVEVPGGWCARNDVGVGAQLLVAGRKLGVQTYNLLRTITEASAEPEASFEKFAPEAEAERLDDGYYSKEPQRSAPDYGGVPNGIAPGERFQDHNLPDDGGNPNSMSQGGDPLMPPVGLGSEGTGQTSMNWHDIDGYDQGYVPYSDPLSNDMESKDTMDGDVAPAAVRMSAGLRRGQTTVDFARLVPELIRGALEEGLQWRPTYVNPRRQMALVGAADVGRWLHALRLDDNQVDLVHDIATSPDGMDKLAQGFLLADDGRGQPLVDSANVEDHGDAPVLVLTRRQQT